MLSTVKPAIKLSANRMIIALIIKRKRPKVIMVTGKVKITNIGFTIKFKRLSTIATMIAVAYVSTPTPGNIFESTTTAKALKRIRNISFIRESLINEKKVLESSDTFKCITNFSIYLLLINECHCFIEKLNGIFCM